MQKIVFTIFLLSFPLLSFSQAGLGYLSHERQIVLSTNFEKRIWGELRLSTNTNYSFNFNDDDGINIRPWIVGHGNILRNSQITMSLGLGVGTNDDYHGAIPFVTLPLAVRFAPFEKAKNVYFLGEAALTNDPDNVLPVSWGVRYLFLKE